MSDSPQNTGDIANSAEDNSADGIKLRESEPLSHDPFVHLTLDEESKSEDGFPQASQNRSIPRKKPQNLPRYTEKPSRINRSFPNKNAQIQMNQMVQKHAMDNALRAKRIKEEIAERMDKPEKTETTGQSKEETTKKSGQENNPSLRVFLERSDGEIPTPVFQEESEGSVKDREASPEEELEELAANFPIIPKNLIFDGDDDSFGNRSNPRFRRDGNIDRTSNRRYDGLDPRLAAGARTNNPRMNPDYSDWVAREVDVFDPYYQAKQKYGYDRERHGLGYRDRLNPYEDISGHPTQSLAENRFNGWSYNGYPDDPYGLLRPNIPQNRAPFKVNSIRSMNMGLPYLSSNLRAQDPGMNNPRGFDAYGGSIQSYGFGHSGPTRQSPPYGSNPNQRNIQMGNARNAGIHPEPPRSHSMINRSVSSSRSQSFPSQNARSMQGRNSVPLPYQSGTLTGPVNRSANRANPGANPNLTGNAARAGFGSNAGSAHVPVGMSMTGANASMGVSSGDPNRLNSQDDSQRSQKSDPLINEKDIEESTMFDGPPSSITDEMKKADTNHARKRRGRIIALIVVVLIALGVVGYMVFSGNLDVGGLFNQDSSEQSSQKSSSGVQSGQLSSSSSSDDSSSAGGDSGTVVYQYTALTSDGTTYDVEETATFSEDGYCEFTTMKMKFPDAEKAKTFTDNLARDYGDSFTLDSLEGANATVTIDNSSYHLDREEYENSLRYSVEDLVILKK